MSLRGIERQRTTDNTVLAVSNGTPSGIQKRPDVWIQAGRIIITIAQSIGSILGANAAKISAPERT
jgi:hypothetical protein